MTVLEVLRPGPLSAVQDLGRVGYAQFGVPPAGAMDMFALQIGNILVGNSRKAAGLEMAMIGIKARFLAHSLIAITGGKSSITLNGEKISGWCSIEVEAGDIVDIGPITEGCRSYLSVAGGIDVPAVLGSRSTYLPAGFGGLEGRALKRGDLLPGGLLSSSRRASFQTRYLSPAWVPEYSKTCTVRVIPGLNQDYFSADQMRVFYEQSYEVTLQSNRMGYRLHGIPLMSAQTGSLISDAVVTGAIQVPPDGQPIILARDRQTTGGYPILGVVAGVDFSKVAQLSAGHRISFQAISLEEAQKLLREQERRLNALSLLFESKDR